MSGTEAVIDITGEIGWDTDPIVFNDKVDAAVNAGCKTLTVRINSMGGYCYDGLSMGDKLETCGLHTVGVVVGSAMSMASYILECCDERVAHANATIMIHQPFAAVSGNVDEIARQSQYLLGIRDTMFEKMASRCGTTGEHLSAEHAVAQYYTAAEALAKGLIDRIENGAGATQPPQPIEKLSTPGAFGGGSIMDDAQTLKAYAMLTNEEEHNEEEEKILEEDHPVLADETSAEEREEENTETAEADESAESDPEENTLTPEGDEDEEEDDLEEEETLPQSSARHGKTKYVTAKQARAMAHRAAMQASAQVLAAVGVPLNGLPNNAGIGRPSASAVTVEQLERMSGLQRLAACAENPALMEKYLQH